MAMAALGSATKFLVEASENPAATDAVTLLEGALQLAKADQHTQSLVVASMNAAPAASSPWAEDQPSTTIIPPSHPNDMQPVLQYQPVLPLNISSSGTQLRTQRLEKVQTTSGEKIQCVSKVWIPAADLQRFSSRESLIQIANDHGWQSDKETLLQILKALHSAGDYADNELDGIYSAACVAIKGGKRTRAS